MSENYIKKRLKQHTAKKTITLLKRFLPLTPKTIVIIILALISGTGASALYIQSIQKVETLSPQTISIPIKPAASSEPNQQTPTTSAAPTPNSTAPTSNTPASQASMPDADGCTPGLSSYQACRDSVAKLVFMNQCNRDMEAANNAFDATYNPARASYNSDIAAQQQEVNNDIAKYNYTQGWGAGVMVAYMHTRAQQYNAIVAPVYTTYVAAFNAMNASGCNLVQTYSDPSLPF